MTERYPVIPSHQNPYSKVVFLLYWSPHIFVCKDSEKLTTYLRETLRSATEHEIPVLNQEPV